MSQNLCTKEFPLVSCLFKRFSTWFPYFLPKYVGNAEYLFFYFIFSSIRLPVKFWSVICEWQFSSLIKNEFFYFILNKKIYLLPFFSNDFTHSLFMIEMHANNME